MCGFVSLRDAYFCRCCVAALRGSLCLMLFVSVALLREHECFLTCRLFYFGQPKISGGVCFCLSLAWHAVGWLREQKDV